MYSVRPKGLEKELAEAANIHSRFIGTDSVHWFLTAITPDNAPGLTAECCKATLKLKPVALSDSKKAVDGKICRFFLGQCNQCGKVYWALTENAWYWLGEALAVQWGWRKGAVNVTAQTVLSEWNKEYQKKVNALRNYLPKNSKALAKQSNRVMAMRVTPLTKEDMYAGMCGGNPNRGKQSPFAAYWSAVKDAYSGCYF